MGGIHTFSLEKLSKPKNYVKCKKWIPPTPKNSVYAAYPNTMAYFVVILVVMTMFDERKSTCILKAHVASSSIMKKKLVPSMQ